MASLTRLATIDVSQVKGLGGKRSTSLKEAGVSNVADLLYHVPRRYIDRTRKEPIAKVPIGSEVTIIGSVRS
ncbi:MAG TPA: ATP-dependent DNA helicase RecG, partial [Acidimicrobiia bacterium]|nr:ATP-dependent DNA helicase RecG [Acidimicrobiia bacterium]